MVTAGIPRLIGMLESVDEVSSSAVKPWAMMALRVVRTIELSEGVLPAGLSPIIPKSAATDP
jgi:hypothetical protein